MNFLPHPARRGKVLAATLGSAAALAMCVVGAVAADDGASIPPAVTAGSMSTGATVTAAYSQTEETSSAVPPVKAPPYGATG
ncbi:MAG: hypothetical protein JWQ86_4851 [Mycobacterium sp.]|jgi:hypothetical protein|nr:hypothetical protein [Mycobacterium sp.]MDT5217017.1 hypothetical protein [Mycobacterium sp.]MDT5388723.1 hypothetical protein [Mycobacterium sp.]